MKNAVVNVILVLLLAALCSAQAGSTGPGPATTAIGPEGMTVPQMEARGDELRRLKMYDEALDYYRAAIRIEKRNWILQNKAGIAELQKTNYRAAEKYFDRAIRLNRNYSDAINNLGVAAYLRRDYGKAVRYYKRALALDETNAAFHSNLGTAWFEQKKYDKAMLEYARALGFIPNSCCALPPAVSRPASLRPRSAPCTPTPWPSSMPAPGMWSAPSASCSGPRSSAIPSSAMSTPRRSSLSCATTRGWRSCSLRPCPIDPVLLHAKAALPSRFPFATMVSVGP